MDSVYRVLFNQSYTDRIYADYGEDMRRRLGTAIPFRLAESPVFVPSELRARLEEAALGILEQLSRPELIRRMKSAIPPAFDAPGMPALPSFAQLDFAIVREEDGSLGPRLIELQGFPSLTAMQVIQCDAWRDTLRRLPGLDRDWSCWFSGLNREEALEIARRTIVGGHDPQEVVLMDLDPRNQKTFPDFAATRNLFGVDAVCPTSLIRRGRVLSRRLEDGREVPVRRIYNRVVFDELVRSGKALPFDYREELDVEWSPHPNWYWTWSKYSIPLLKHASVPPAAYLSELEELPVALAKRYVLKPLFSFAGGGVQIEPTAEDIAAIPPGERSNWCLQEKISYAPALVDTDGNGVKVEIRLMFLKPDEQDRLRLVQNLCRLSRGKMMGVDFNKDFTWVGSSIGLFAP